MRIIYSSEKLWPWEAAATWIDETGNSYIQLRPELEKGHYLFYTRDEILAHEAVHVARAKLKEPRFEEILAYQTSQNRFRKYWGPLLRSSPESLIFLASILLGIIHPSIPIITTIFYTTRLVYNQAIFQRALKKAPLSTLIPLTDAEIIRLASGS
jgi:hypothetical protein